MAGYQKPGILITEVETPNTTIVVDRPTVVSIVGAARGNEIRSEVIRLIDSDEVTLTGTNVLTSPAESFVVRDINRLNVVYSQGTANDYTLTTDANGVTTIKRSLYTAIASQEQVVAVIKTTGGTGSAIQSTNVQFNYDNPSALVAVANGGTITTTGGAPGDTDISVQRAGRYSITSDYTVNLSNGRIARAGAYGPDPDDCHIIDGQTVYVTYTTNNGENEYVDEVVVLSGTTQTPLANSGVDTSSIIVRNRALMGDSTTAVAVFVAGSNGNAGVDFEFDFDDPAGATEFTMLRNTDGPTTMNVADNRVDVRVDYQYIPENYYLPTLLSSYQEFENKYGPAFNSDGTVANPISASAYMCFSAGSNEVIAQPLFTTSESGLRIAGTESNSDHWATTLESLRGQTAINVLVPAVGQNANITDSTLYAIFVKFAEHIEYMNQDNEYIVAIFGEDATRNGALTTTAASVTTLQTHAQQLGQRSFPERTVLVSPAAFTMPNPVTGRSTLMGGQYVAAKIAGMLGRYPVQSSMTRRSVPGVSDVAVYRNETEKNEDASAGLFVIENKNGVVRVRHAITTSVGSDTDRELNAMRSKFFMIESIKNTLDTNTIGKVLADNRAPFIVSTTVAGVLEYLRNTGAISGYNNVDVTANPNSPTAMVVRFNYSLPYAINNIEVALSLESTTGTVSAL